MRRHTTKHPSGPMTSAMPMPPRNARSRYGSMLMRLLMAFFMAVAMCMVIHRHHPRHIRSEKRDEFGILRHHARRARTTHMMKQAHDAAGGSHHHMQIV